MDVRHWIRLGFGVGYEGEAGFRRALLSRYRAVLSFVLLLEVFLLLAFSASDLLWADWHEAAVLWQWRLLPTLPTIALLAIALRRAEDEQLYRVIRWHALILGLAIEGVIFSAWDMGIPLPREGFIITLLAIFAASGLLLLDALVVTGVLILTFVAVSGWRYAMDARWEMDLLFLLATWTLGGFSTFVRDMSLRQIHRTFLTLQQEATSDYLTETDNRRQLVRNLEQLWRRAQRHGWTLAIMMADLDHFKRINDEYGHDEGDKYLQAVASALSSSMNRADDIVGRYGGEEFVLISVVKSREEAERLCQRLVQEVRELELPNTASPGGRQTVSIGCVVVGPAGLQLDWSMAVKLADMLLYLQKAAGRDGYQIARV